MNKNDDQDKKVPYGQKFLDRPFLLLFLGIVVMAVFYTGWGFYEILTLPESKLP